MMWLDEVWVFRWDVMVVGCGGAWMWWYVPYGMWCCGGGWMWWRDVVVGCGGVVLGSCGMGCGGWWLDVLVVVWWCGGRMWWRYWNLVVGFGGWMRWWDVVVRCGSGLWCGG